MAAFWIAVVFAYIVLVGVIVGSVGWRTFHPHH
jgi:hypothetical protein